MSDVLDMVGRLGIGTRIRFNQTLTSSACEDSPAFLYATKGETGEITGYGTKEGYWVKTDSWPNAFGAAPHEFDVLPEQSIAQAGA